MIKILKNKSNTIITILGRDIEIDGEIEVQAIHYLKLADVSCNLHGLITSGDIVVNNGTEDLDPVSGLIYAKLLSPNDASDIIFNVENWESANVTSAIVEAVSKAAVTYLGGFDHARFVENGSAQNKWLDNGCQNVNSNETPYVILFDCNMIGITFSNSRASASFDLQVWKSTKGSGISDKTLIKTVEVRGKRLGYDNTMSIPLKAGDKIAVYIKDQGTNITDPVVDITFQVTSVETSSGQENFSGDF